MAGLRALAGPHRAGVSISEPRRLQHSVNLDGAISATRSTGKQWDYIVGWCTAQGADCCCFVEVHPANAAHVGDVVAKKHDAEVWLAESARPVAELGAASAGVIGGPVWHWVATEATITIRAGSPQSRRLAQAGISGPKRRVELR